MNNVLVIDDESEIRELVSKTLTSAGYNVSTASTMMEAEQMILKKDWDLVVSDIMIPHIGGFELVELVKAKKPIAVIVMTGMDKDVLDATLTNADAILTKPISGKQLLETIRQLAPVKEA